MAVDIVTAMVALAPLPSIVIPQPERRQVHTTFAGLVVVGLGTMVLGVATSPA